MIALFTALIVSAAQPEFRPPPKCWEGAQNELTHCAAAEFKYAETAMATQIQRTEQVYQRFDGDNKSLNLSHVGALRSGQSAWRAFRDGHCSLFNDGDGSLAPMLWFICQRDLTRERTKQLKELTLNPATGQPFYEDQK